MKIVFLLIFCASCSWTSFHQKLAEKQIDRVHQEFLLVAKKNKVNVSKVSFHFADLKEIFPKSKDWAGACAKNHNIYFDIRWWNNSYSIDKEQIILHELGHCSLGLKHGKGLMIQEPIKADVYLKNKAALIQDLFDQHKKLK